MFYSIGEVSTRTGISISALRYYDREGLFPNMQRSNGGARVFSDVEMDTLRIIDCLKASGMSIQSIKEFLQWCQEGDASLAKRQQLFHNQMAEIEKQMEHLQQVKNILQFKCWYYDTALAAGTEDAVQTLTPAEIPVEIRAYMP